MLTSCLRVLRPSSQIDWKTPKNFSRQCSHVAQDSLALGRSARQHPAKGKVTSEELQQALSCHAALTVHCDKEFKIPSRRLKAFQSMLEHARIGHIRTP